MIIDLVIHDMEQRLEVNWKVCVRADKQKKKKERKQVIWLQTFLSLGLLVSAHHIAFSHIRVPQESFHPTLSDPNLRLCSSRTILLP
jgi:hypothetical protein